MLPRQLARQCFVLPSDQGDLAGLPLLIFRKLVLISHVEILFEGIYCKPI